MKLSYVLQLKDFLILLLFGFVFGICYGIISATNLPHKNLILKNILDFLFALFGVVLFIILVLFVNLGEFRLFLLFGYIIGIILERITLGKIFAKGYIWVYNTVVASVKKFAKSRVGRIIFKWKTKLRLSKSQQ